MEHLQDMADALHETAMGFRWLAGLAGAAGNSTKSSEVQNQADTLDAAAVLLEAIQADFDAAEDVEPEEDIDDDDEPKAAKKAPAPHAPAKK